MDQYAWITKGKSLARSFPEDQENRFAAWWAAKDYVRNLGYAAGGHQRGAPVGCMYDPDDEWDVAKWRGMTRAQRLELHGVILFRGNAVEVWLVKRQ